MANRNYILMHKHIPAADIQLDGATGVIRSIGTIKNPEHIPVGIPVKNGIADRQALNSWWAGRAIPASRDRIQDALKKLGVSSTQLLLEKCLGLSLSDQYWICPVSENIQWEDINFFQNDFSDDVGNILFGRGPSSERMNMMSPDNTSDGWLKKKWVIADGKRCLLKGGSGATQQEPYNEVIASIIMKRLGIPHTSYSLTVQEDYPYSLCEDFITSDSELITAWYIMQTERKPNHISIHQHYLNCCSALGIPGIQLAVDQMIVLDYIIFNEDRHQNNFGVLRDAETLKYTGAAPIYDSGTSLWFDKPATMIGSVKAVCKPFKTSHEEQIKLVSSFDWLELEKLDNIEDEWMELTKNSLFLDENRRRAIANALRNRIQRLDKILRSSIHMVSGTGGDVVEDIKYSGYFDPSGP